MPKLPKVKVFYRFNYRRMLIPQAGNIFKKGHATMDFDLTKEQKIIQKAAREFAKGEFTDVARDLDINETYPAEIVKKAKELDLVGLFIPEAYGGPGCGYLEQAMVLEEFWKIDPGIGQQLSSISFGAEELILFGTEEQKKKWLPPLFEGDAVMGFAITEPDAGSDTAAVTTTAVRDGDEYVINGSKVMIGNGTVGTFMLVYCLTNPEVERKTARHSIIIVETDREGYKADPMHGKMGLRASDTSAIYFNNVKHVKGRKQFGRPLAAFQATQFKIAEMATKVETARTITYKSAWLLDQGKPDTKLTAMAKLYACHVAIEVVDESLQLHGGYGYFNDYDIERFYRAAKVLEIYEGTKEVEKIVISREILGKF